MSDFQTSIATNIRAARERLRITQEHVAEALRIPRSAVSEMEAGKRDISASELFALAQLFGESMEQLLGLEPHPPEEELVMLRAEAVTTTGRAALNRFVHLCRTYRELEEWLGETRDPDVRPVRAILSTYEQAHALADQERKRLELGLAPGRQLLEAIEERVRIKVFALDLEDGVSGASIHSALVGPAVLVNRMHTPGRQVFTLAHEYFHLVTEGRVARSRGLQSLHLCEAQPPGARKDRAEQLADQFAGRLLLPPEHFVERLRLLRREDGTIDRLDLIGLARYFGVSVQAVFVELAVLKLVPWDEAKRAYGDPELQDQILQMGGEQALEPTRFRRLAVKAYLAERISRTRLAELLEVNVADVDEEVRHFGGGEPGRGVRIALPR